MQENHVQCLNPTGLHKMHYTDWGAHDNPRIVVCVHGLSRNCRDFDALAQTLAPDFRVVCPDIVGRGQSDWLAAKELYVNPQYLADLTTLIGEVLWIDIEFLGRKPVALSTPDDIGTHHAKIRC